MDTRLHCPLSDLFEFTEAFGQVVEHTYLGPFARLRRRARIAFIQLTRGVYISQKKVEDFLRQQTSFEELERYQTIFISTWEHFYPSNGLSQNSLCQNFVPIASLRSKLRQLPKTATI